MSKSLKSTLALVLTGCLLALCLAGCGKNKEAAAETAAPTQFVNEAGETVSVTEPVAAGSYDEIYNAFVSVQKAANEIYDASEQESSESQLVNAEAETFGDPDYAKAAVPAEGVEQGDLIVSDGQYLYMVCGSELVIVAASGADTAETGRTFVANLSPEGYSGGETVQKIYLSGTNLYVLTYEILYKATTGDASTEGSFDSSEKVHVKQYDVSDPTAPAIVADYAQSGRYLNSYLSGGVLYVIGAYSIWTPDQADPATFVPTITKNGEDALLEPGSIFLCPGMDSTDYTVLSAIDTASGQCLASEAVTGYNAWSAADGETLYLARTSYSYETGEPYQEAQYSVTDYTYNAYTRLLKLPMDGSLSIAGSGTVEGYLFNQGAMELSGGELYLATVCNGYSYKVFTDETYGFVNQQMGDRVATNAVYALNSDLLVERTLQDTAAGDTVYDIRFTGSTAYVMNYDDLTPKFVIDMSAENLKSEAVSGLSGIEHSLFYFGAGQTAGVGAAYDETGAITGVQLSVYDTAGVNLQNLDTAFVSEQWTNAMNNGDAIRVLPEAQTVAVPTDTGYSLYAWQDGSLVSLGQVDLGYVSAGTRVFTVGDTWYFCNDAAVSVFSAADWTQLAKVEFAYG